MRERFKAELPVLLSCITNVYEGKKNFLEFVDASIMFKATEWVRSLQEVVSS